MITDAAALGEACGEFRRAGCVGFDTEFIRERSYFPKLCLVQAAAPHGPLLLVDPFKVDVAPFWEIVTDPAVEKVVHAGGQDLEICALATGRPAANVFDVQVAAGLVGMTYPLSYGNLVRTILGRRLSKGKAFSEWARRPLTEAQLRYAAADVAYLEALRASLEPKLERRGRIDWLREEMATARAQADARSGPDGAWLTVNGRDRLGAEELAVLRELAAWRDRAACEANVPPQTLLRDPVLVALARRMPTSKHEIDGTRGFPSDLVKPWAAAILEAIARGRAVPASARPAPAPTRDMDPETKMLVDLTLAAGQGVCLSEKVDHGLFASRADYAALVACLAAGSPEGQEPPALLSGWRRAFAGEALRALVEGRARLRVKGDPSKPRLDLETGHAGGHGP